MDRQQLLAIMAAIIYAGTAPGKKKNEDDAIKIAEGLLDKAEQIESMRNR